MADPTQGVLPSLDDVITAPTLGKATAAANQAQDILDRTILRGTIENMGQQTQVIQQTQQQATKVYQDIENERKRLRVLQEKQGDAARLPKFVQRIGGLFDPELNPDYMANQVRQSAGLIDDKAFQLESFSNIAGMQSKIFEQQLMMQSKQYEMLTSQVDRSLKLRGTIEEEARYRTQLGFQYSAEKRANEQMSMSKESHAAEMERTKRETRAYEVGRIDDTVLQDALAGNNANITKQEAEAELQRREANKLSLSSAKAGEQRAVAGEQRAATEFKFQQEAHQLAMLTDPELQAAVEGKNPTIPVPLAKNEQLRRDSQKIEFTRLQNALEMDKMQHDAASQAMVDNAKARLLNSMNPNEVQQLAEKAKNNGGTVDMGQGITFTSREISSIQATILGENEAARKRVLDELNAQDTWSLNLNEADRLNVNLATAVGDARMMAQTQQEMQTYLAQINNAVKVGAHKEAQVASEAMLKAMKDKVDRVISTYPEAQRPFVRSRIEGTPADTGQALSFIGSSALNRNSLNNTTGGPWGELYGKYSDLLRGEFKASGAPTDENGNIDIMSILAGEKGNTTLKFEQVAAGVFSKNDFTSDFRNTRNMQAINAGLQALAKINPVVFNGLDVTKYVGQELDKQTGQSMQTFSDVALLADLRTKWNLDVQSGRVKPNEPSPTGIINAVPYDQQLIQFLGTQQFQEQIYNTWTQGLDMRAYAFSELVHGGDPLTGYQAFVNVLGSKFADYYAKLTQQTLQRMQPQTTGAQMLQQQPAVGQVPNFFSGVNALPSDFPRPQ